MCVCVCAHARGRVTLAVFLNHSSQSSIQAEEKAVAHERRVEVIRRKTVRLTAAMQEASNQLAQAQEAANCAAMAMKRAADHAVAALQHEQAARLTALSMANAASTAASAATALGLGGEPATRVPFVRPGYYDI